MNYKDKIREMLKSTSISLNCVVDYVWENKLFSEICDLIDEEDDSMSILFVVKELPRIDQKILKRVELLSDDDLTEQQKRYKREIIEDSILR